MRSTFHPFAQQNAFRRCDDHRGADLISDVVLLAPTWANAYFIRGYCLQDLHRLAEAKKAIAQAVALSPNVLPESRTRRFSLQFPQTPRLRQETLVFSNSMFNRLLRTAYVLLPGSRKRLWYDYCFYRRHDEYHKQDFPRFNDRRCLISGLRSDGIREHDAAHTGLWESSFRRWRRIQRLVTRFCSRHDGLRAQAIYNAGHPTQASKPSAWNTMSISPPARPSITESAKEPSMAAFLVAILIPFPGERRGST